MTFDLRLSHAHRVFSYNNTVVRTEVSWFSLHPNTAADLSGGSHLNTARDEEDSCVVRDKCYHFPHFIKFCPGIQGLEDALASACDRTNSCLRGTVACSRAAVHVLGGTPSGRSRSLISPCPRLLSRRQGEYGSCLGTLGSVHVRRRPGLRE